MLEDIDYEHLYEGFIDNLKEKFSIEIEEKDIQWTGFWSQGDGLSFDFKIYNRDAINFLKAIEFDNVEDLLSALEKDKIEIEIYTTKNHFGTYYCHSNTRDINVNISFDEDLKEYNMELYELLDNNSFIKDLENMIKSWYGNKCDELYNELSEYYYEHSSIDECEELEDEELIISDKIDSMVDPEMNIFKIREMFQEAYDLSNTKSESEYLIDQFVKNFDKEYFIVKRDK